MAEVNWNHSHESTPGLYVVECLNAHGTLHSNVRALLKADADATGRHRCLRDFERTLADAVCTEVLNRLATDLLEASERQEVNFLGFFFRGRFIRGGRHDAVAFRLRNRVKGVPDGMLAGDDWPSLHRKMLDVYLSMFGKPYSINQLVLERERLPDVDHHKAIEIVFGPRANFRVAPETNASLGLRRLVVPESDISLLCPDAAQRGYKHVILRVQRDFVANGNVAPEDYTREVPAAVSQSSRERAIEEVLRIWLLSGAPPAEATDFLRYCDAEEAAKQDRLVEHLRDWLRGIQAYTFFRRQWGIFWYTFPLSPHTLTDVQFVTHVPACALTLVSSASLSQGSQARVAALLAGMLAYIEKHGVPATPIYTSYNDSAVRAAAHRHGEMRRGDKRKDRGAVLAASKSVFHGAPPGFSQLGFLAVMLLGERLARETIEGKPLRLRAVFCTPYELLSNVSGARGLLRDVVEFEVDDAGTIPAFGIRPEHDDFKDYVEQLGNSILANGYLLEEPSAVLVLVAAEQHGIEPFGIVRMRDQRDVEEQLKRLTGECPGSVVLQIEQKAAVLLGGGGPLARYESGRGQWRALELVGEFVFNSIHHYARRVLGASFKLKEAACRRLAQAIIQVRKDGHGALVYLSTEEALEDCALSERLAKPWPFVDKKRIEDIHPEGFLASLLAMDGETMVFIEDGQVRGRYFLLPTRAPNLFTNDGDVTEEYRGKWKQLHAEAKILFVIDGQKRKSRVEPLGAILAMGTRHRKAMMLSNVLGDKGVIITVSSSGTIRVWSDGLPVSRWPEA